MHCLDEALRFPVGLGPVHPGALVFQAQNGARLPPLLGAVGAALPLSESTLLQLMPWLLNQNTARTRKPTLVAFYSSGSTSTVKSVHLSVRPPGVSRHPLPHEPFQSGRHTSSPYGDHRGCGDQPVQCGPAIWCRRESCLRVTHWYRRTGSLVCRFLSRHNSWVLSQRPTVESGAARYWAMRRIVQRSWRSALAYCCCCGSSDRRWVR
jgi:hypothetical protein